MKIVGLESVGNFMHDHTGFLNDLTEEQRAVCIEHQNCLLTACPGSGKTRTIVYRLAYLTELFPDSEKLHIAITYTNKAADEIWDRLHRMGVQSQSIWVGTIHQFCLEFFLRPYAMYHTRLSHGFRVIDDYEKVNYIRQIVTSLGLHFQNDDMFPNKQVLNTYRECLKVNNEIDFDDILTITLELLKSYPFIAHNVSRIMRTIHVDEYQDTRDSQYRILAVLGKENPTIQFMFVGDPNQAIYGSLGGVAYDEEKLQHIFGSNFVTRQLTGCFRSSSQIVDFYQYFGVQDIDISSRGHRLSFSKIKYDKDLSVQELPGEIASLIYQEMERGIPASEICVIAPQWGLLYSFADKFHSEYMDIELDAPKISPFKYEPGNVFYLLAFSPKGEREFIRKRRATQCLTILRDVFGAILPLGYDEAELLYQINHGVRLATDISGIATYRYVLWNVMRSMHIQSFVYQKLGEICAHYLNLTQQRMQRYHIVDTVSNFKSYFREKRGVTLTTIHGVKGLEFTTVIAYGLLNGLIPHWNYILDDSKKRLRREETMRLLYVLCSRAKERIYLFSEQGRKTHKGNEYKPTDELVQYHYSYD